MSLVAPRVRAAARGTSRSFALSGGGGVGHFSIDWLSPLFFRGARITGAPFLCTRARGHAVVMGTMMEPTIHPWQRLSSARIAQTRVCMIDSVRFRHPQRGSEGDFVVIRPPDWVNVLALTAAGELVLVRQFRFGVEALSLEIPGGVMEPGESPLETAVRELREETGFISTCPPQLLGSVQPNPAIQSNRCHIVLIEGVRREAEQDWDADEEIAVELRPVEAVLAAARSGEIVHSLVLSALFLLEPLWRARGAV